jgi:predicted HicB family RNase H-like nuclease
MKEYKGYVGHVKDEADIFYGDVVNTRDVIMLQGELA